MRKLLLALLMCGMTIPAQAAIIDGSFESFVTHLGIPNHSPGVWGGDTVDSVGVENGVTPLDGVRMGAFRDTFFGTSLVPGSASSNLVQFLDVTTLGGPSVSVTANFNRGAGSPNSEFNLLMAGFPGPLANVPFGGISASSFSAFTDADPNTWQSLTGTYTIPGNADVLAIMVSAVEGFDTVGAAEFAGGNYVDNVTVTATPIPGALFLFGPALGLLGFLGWRRRNGTAPA